MVSQAPDFIKDLNFARGEAHFEERIQRWKDMHEKNDPVWNWTWRTEQITQGDAVYVKLIGYKTTKKIHPPSTLDWHLAKVNEDF